MARTHREFFEVVQAMMSCADAQLAARLRGFIVHAQAHFGEEDRDMAETRFPAADCHADEHAAVLSSAHEVLARVEAGDVAIGRAFVAELARWFPSQVAHLDSALAHWLGKPRRGARRWCCDASWHGPEATAGYPTTFEASGLGQARESRGQNDWRGVRPTALVPSVGRSVNNLARRSGAGPGHQQSLVAGSFPEC